MSLMLHVTATTTSGQNSGDTILFHALPSLGRFVNSWLNPTICSTGLLITLSLALFMR